VKKILVTVALLSVVASPAFAQVSRHRAAAIEKCTQQANAEYGPSGDVAQRRWNNALYAACMSETGEAP
jgi:hypothetical protein